MTNVICKKFEGKNSKKLFNYELWSLCYIEGYEETVFKVNSWREKIIKQKAKAISELIKEIAKKVYSRNITFEKFNVVFDDLDSNLVNTKSFVEYGNKE